MLSSIFFEQQQQKSHTHLFFPLKNPGLTLVQPFLFAVDSLGSNHAQSQAVLSGTSQVASVATGKDLLICLRWEKQTTLPLCQSGSSEYAGSERTQCATVYQLFELQLVDPSGVRAGDIQANLIFCLIFYEFCTIHLTSHGTRSVAVGDLF